jgi:hypothetical protein
MDIQLENSNDVEYKNKAPALFSMDPGAPLIGVVYDLFYESRSRDSCMFEIFLRILHNLIYG